MPDHEFLFALRLCEGGRFEEMLRELTRRVLGHLGCAAGAADDLCGQLLAGLAQAGHMGTSCDVQFCAHGGEIEVILSAGGRPLFRASRVCPDGLAGNRGSQIR